MPKRFYPSTRGHAEKVTLAKPSRTIAITGPEAGRAIMDAIRKPTPEEYADARAYLSREAPDLLAVLGLEAA